MQEVFGMCSVCGWEAKRCWLGSAVINKMTANNSSNGLPTLNLSADVVNIYLRNSSKQARLVPVRTPLAPSDLVIMASVCFNIPESRIVLFHNGYRVDNYTLPLTLAQRSIVHVIDHRNIESQQISVNFRPLWNTPPHKLVLSPDTQVKEIIQHYLVPRLDLSGDRFFLVYVGKILNRSNLLREQFIQDGAQITVVQHRSAKDIFEKVVYDHNSSARVQKHISAVGTSCPVTYITTIESLKKKNQMQANLQHNQISQVSSAAPKPYPNIGTPYLLNESNFSNPLAVSALNISKISKIEEVENKSSNEKVAPSVGPSSESERVAPPSQVESAQAPQSKLSNGEGHAAVAVQLEKPKTVVEQKGKLNQEKMLALEQNIKELKGKDGALQSLLSQISSNEKSAAPE